MAVKVIDKLRFPTKQESQLRNEVAILQVAMMGKLGVGGWVGCEIPLQQWYVLPTFVKNCSCITICLDPLFKKGSAGFEVWSYFLQAAFEYVHQLFYHIMEAFVCFLFHSLISCFSESASSGHRESGVHV